MQKVGKDELVEVVDNTTFKLWCNQMCFNTYHASAFFNISRSNVYKYLDTNNSVAVKGPILRVCQMVSMLPLKQRLVFIKDVMKETGHDWPAIKPIR